MVWRCSGCVNPGSTARKARKVRIISPALCRAKEILGPAYFRAEIDPNNRPDNKERTRVKPSARASRQISFKRGTFAGPS